jgi:hypothetical protein
VTAELLIGNPQRKLTMTIGPGDTRLFDFHSSTNAFIFANLFSFGNC